MGAYIGPLHDMVDVACLTSLDEAPEDQPSLTIGNSGRIRHTLTPYVRRRWSAQIGVANPAELATLQELYYAHRGRPVWLATETAQVQNLLCPSIPIYDRSEGIMVPTGYTAPSQERIQAAGTVETADGVAASSVTYTGSVAYTLPVPVKWTRPVTVSAYVPAGDTITLQWVAAGGSTTTVATSTPAANNYDRVSVSVPSVPAGRTACRIRFEDGGVIVRPQITWTADVVPYVAPKGCEKALLGPVNESASVALSDGSDNQSSFAYSMTEVG